MLNAKCGFVFWLSPKGGFSVSSWQLAVLSLQSLIFSLKSKLAFFTRRAQWIAVVRSGFMAYPTLRTTRLRAVTQRPGRTEAAQASPFGRFNLFCRSRSRGPLPTLPPAQSSGGQVKLRQAGTPDARRSTLPAYATACTKFRRPIKLRQAGTLHAIKSRDAAVFDNRTAQLWRVPLVSTFPPVPPCPQIGLIPNTRYLLP